MQSGQSVAPKRVKIWSVAKGGEVASFWASSGKEYVINNIIA